MLDKEDLNESLHLPDIDLQVTWKGVEFVTIATNHMKLIERSNKRDLKRTNLRKGFVLNTLLSSDEVNQTKGKLNFEINIKSNLDSQSYDSSSDSSNSDEGKSKSGFTSAAVKMKSYVNRHGNKFKTKTTAEEREARMRGGTVENLIIMFEQNRPSNFVGIRKLRTYDIGDNRDDLKFQKLFSEEALKLQLHSSEVVKDISCSQVSLSKQQKLSSSLMDKISSNKLGIRDGSSSKGELLSIFQAILADKMIQKHAIMKVLGFQKQLEIIDWAEKIPRKRLKQLLVEKYYRSDHPRRRTNYNKYPETEWEKLIIRNCIFNNKFLVSLLKDRSFYSFIEQNEMSRIDVELTRADNEEDIYIKPEDQRDELSNTTCAKINEKVLKVLTVYSTNIMSELCREIKQFNGFYLPLFQAWNNKVLLCDYLVKEHDPEQIKKLVKSLTKCLSDNRNNPFSESRIITQQFIKGGDSNPALFQELTSTVDSWMDQILKCLLSTYDSVRIEAYLTLAYLFSKAHYVRALTSSMFTEPLYDTIATLIRCMDLKPKEFPLYFSLMGFLFNYCHNQTLLDCVMDRAPYSTCLELICRWPKLYYLAFRFWSKENFNNNILQLQRLVSNLENHCIREPLSYKYIKEAISIICQRFEVTSNIITIWPNINNKKFPD